MHKDQKKVVVEELTNLFANNTSFIVTEFIGITSNSVNELRTKLAAEKVKYVVVKNTLAKIALKNSEKDNFCDYFSGNNAVIFSGEDPVKAAKILKDFAKQEKKIQVKFGVLDQDALDAKAVEQLADLPDQPTLIATFASMLNSPMTNFVRMMNEPITSFTRAIKQVAEQKEN